MGIGQNMQLYTSFWGQHKTFKMMPVTEDCPYMEAIYDPNVDMLVVLNKVEKENMQMVERLDENGDLKPTKMQQARSNGKKYQEQRVQMRVHQEHYIVERNEIDAFIKRFCINAEDYDHSQYYRKPEDQIFVPEQAPLVDEKGAPLRVEKQK